MTAGVWKDMTSRKREKTEKELREFGLVMTIALLVFSAILLWRHRVAMALFLLTLSVLFLAPAVFVPARLRSAEKYWMKFADKLSTVMTVVIMSLTFFGAVMPIGLLLRLSGKDILGRFRPKKPVTTYWIPVEVDGPGSRPRRPF